MFVDEDDTRSFGCYKPHVSGHAELPCPLRTILVYLTPLGEVCHAVKQLNVLLSSANLGRVWEWSNGLQSELHMGKNTLNHKGRPCSTRSQKPGSRTEQPADSLFGRFSASLSFPLVSPGRKEEQESFRLYRRPEQEQWKTATLWGLEWGMRVRLVKVKLAQLLKEGQGPGDLQRIWNRQY